MRKSITLIWFSIMIAQTSPTIPNNVFRLSIQSENILERETEGRIGRMFTET